MPVTDQRLRHVMPRKGGNLDKCDETKDDAYAGEGESDEGIGGSGIGKRWHNIVNHGGYGNYKATAIPELQP
jgi:hypothetical protein